MTPVLSLYFPRCACFIYSFFSPLQNYLSIAGHFEWTSILSFPGCSNRAARVKDMDCFSYFFTAQKGSSHETKFLFHLIIQFARKVICLHLYTKWSSNQYVVRLEINHRVNHYSSQNSATQQKAGTSRCSIHCIKACSCVSRETTQTILSDYIFLS